MLGNSNNKFSYYEFKFYKLYRISDRSVVPGLVASPNQTIWTNNKYDS